MDTPTAAPRLLTLEELRERIRRESKDERTASWLIKQYEDRYGKEGTRSIALEAAQALASRLNSRLENALRQQGQKVPPELTRQSLLVSALLRGLKGGAA